MTKSGTDTGNGCGGRRLPLRSHSISRTDSRREPPHAPSGARTFPRASALLVSLGISLLFPPQPASAQSPTENLKVAVGRTVEILDNNDLKAGGTEGERRILLKRVIRPLFDFPEMAQRALGSHWADRTPEEREEFIELFTRLLESSYLGKIESYRGGNIRYVEETVTPPFAEVKTFIDTAAGRTVSADYRMLRRGEQWRIYDVLIDGVSVLRNCRSQFGSMLRYYSFQKLIEKLRAMPACRG